ncbi:MAG TPA: MarR family transcriptional regulator [Burkholderiaceae bacterium]|nr:MarR family transcriptional regulator [Burkholderiaceae bacterium]
MKDSLSDIIDGVAIPTSYKIGYISNYYREPSFREIEQKLGLTRPETLSLIFLCFTDGITVTDICDFSGHLKANISRAAVALERKGLITRQPSSTDQRRQLLYVTTEGRAVHDRFMGGLRQREAQMLSCLNSKEREQLDALLRKLCGHARDWSADPVVDVGQEDVTL